MRFVTIFPMAKNVHLTKDVGMIPYVLGKFFNYESFLACYKNDDYKYTNSEMKELKISHIKKITSNEIINVIIYLWKNAANIDVLNLYHIKIQTYVYILLYKFLNKKGKIYLKLDADETIPNKLKRNILINKIKVYVLRKSYLTSVETTKILKMFKDNNINLNIEYIPNGCLNLNNKSSFKNKENIICTAARIGTRQKSIDILMEAYKKAFPNIKNWKLNIIGPIEETFKIYIKDYFKKNPYLINKVNFLGEITDRKLIFEQYKKSKIFSLTSKFESFGLVLVEAMSEGCFILMTDVSSANDITKNNLYGKKFEIDNVNELSNLLIKFCNNNQYLKTMHPKIIKHYEENFNWVNICKKIDFLLNGV